MSKLRLPLLVLTLAAICMPAMAGERVVKRVPAGAVAFHFVFDLSFREAPPPVFLESEFVGYIAFIEGVDGPLFKPEMASDGMTEVIIPSENSAYFTLRLTKPVPTPISLPVDPDELLNASIFMPGAQATVYFNSSPDGRNWSDPDTFSDGMPIAVLDESALLSTRAEGADAFFNVFSARLIDSTPIDFNGQRIDFRKLVPNGVTITNFGNAGRPPYGDPSDLFGTSGGGTAIAIGGKLRDKSDDD